MIFFLLIFQSTSIASGHNFMVAVPASDGKKGNRAKKRQNVSQGQTGAFVLLFNAQKVHNLENIEPQKEQFMTSNDARSSR